MIRFLDVVFLVLLFLHICISTQILLPILTTNPFTRAAVYVPPLRKNQSSPFYGGGHFSLWALASRGFSAAEFRSHCFRPTHPFRYVSVRFAFQSLIKRAGVGWGHGKWFQAVSQQTRSVRLRLFFFFIRPFSFRQWVSSPIRSHVCASGGNSASSVDAAPRT